MPDTMGYGPPGSDEWKTNQDAGETELAARRQRHQKAWDYYDGKHKEHLKPDSTQTEDNVILNKIGQLIDSGVASLMGRNDQGLVEGVKFEVIGDEPGEPSMLDRLRRAGRNLTGREAPEQTWLDRVWDINQRTLTQQNLAMNGGVTGHCFVRIVPDGLYYWPEQMTAPRLINLNPDIVTVFWDAADVQRVMFYRLDYGKESDKVRRREDIVRTVNDNGDDLNAWTIITYETSNGGRAWRQVGEPVPWGRPWSPIVDWPNLPRPNTYYGVNDLGTAGQLNDSLNFLASNMQRILKHHAHPKLVGTGFNADDVQSTAINDFWAISNENAALHQLEMMSDMGSSMAFVQLMIRSIFDQGRELDPASVQDRLGDLTNFGLRVLNGSTLGKVAVKRMLYGRKGFTRINQALLDLGNFPPATPVQNVWADPLPTNQLEEAQALDVDRRHGASVYSYLQRRGYDPLQEAQHRQDETALDQEAVAAFLGNANFGL